MAADSLVTVIPLSMVVASMSYTLTESALCAGVRKRAAAASQSLGSLLHCGYCTGHWIALGVVIIYRPRLLDGWWLLDYGCTVLVIAWLAAAQWALLSWIVRGAGK